MRFRYLLIAVCSVFLLAACEVEISTTGDSEPSTSAQDQPTATASSEPDSDARDRRQSLSWDEVLDEVRSSVVTVRAIYPATEFDEAYRFDGTGIVLTDQGHILTTSGTVTGAESVLVSLSGDSSERTAQVLGSSGCDDLAIIQVDDLAGLVPATIGQLDSVGVGTEVASVGFPVGDFETVDPTISQGLISQLDQSIDQFDGLITHDGEMIDGVEGGPLVNQYGEVIGMNVMSMDDPDSSIGYAVPFDYAQSITGALQAGQNIRWLGISMMENEFPEIYETEDGVVVSLVVNGSPAEATGLQIGHVIIEMQGETITHYTDVCRVLRQYDDGDEIDLEVIGINEGLLERLAGTAVLGMPEASTPLEVIWSEAHDAAFDDESRDSEIDSEGGTGDSLMNWAKSISNPPASELDGSMTYGIGFGSAMVHLSHWAHCDGEWVHTDTETFNYEADIWIDTPRIGEPNPVFLTVQSVDYDIDGTFLIISGQEDNQTGEFTKHWDLTVDGIYIAGTMVNENFDPIEAGGYIWSHHYAEPCEPGNSELMMRSPAMSEGAIVGGYIGPETAYLEIIGSTWDGQREFIITIEAEMVGWDDLDFD